MKKLKPKEPKPIALVFTAASGIGLGLLLGVFLLLTNPVNRVSQEPSPETLAEPGNYTTYFVPGRAAESESTNLRAALGRLQRRSPGPVSLSEEELNYLLKQYLAQPDEASAAEEAESSSFDQLNVHMVDDRMFLSGRMVIDPDGDRFEMLVKSEVAFENTDAGPRLLVKDMTFNSLPIPAVAGIARSLLQSKLDPESLPADWVKMWENIREVQVLEGRLIAVVGLRRA